MKNKIIAALTIIVIAQAFLLLGAAKKEKKEVTSLSKSKPQILKTEKETAPQNDPDVAKIAIVLDDWGYNLKNLDTLKKIKSPLTLAVLPNLTYSRRIAEEAYALNKEILLHLPLEPYKRSQVPLEENTITADMTTREMITILQKDLMNISHAAGVSNHQGSKFTTDEKAITTIFSQLKKQNLFFLDSLTSKSICKKIANKSGVRFASRDVFLDNENDEEYIANQLRILTEKAKLRGSAIGIGHDRITTLKVLERLIPELEQEEGIKFVFISELVK